MMARGLGGLVLVLGLGAVEVLKTDYRAVTLDPHGRVRFRVPDLERVTGSSGACLEEGMDLEEPETVYVQATCAGLRTSLVWTKAGRRMHVLACAEAEERTPAQVKLRQTLQRDVKGWPSVTACVRNGRVELWGWVRTEADEKKVRALELKYGLERVRSFVERLTSDGDVSE